MVPLCLSRDSIKSPGTNRSRSLLATRLATPRRIYWNPRHIYIAIFIALLHVCFRDLRSWANGRPWANSAAENSERWARREPQTWSTPCPIPWAGRHPQPLPIHLKP